MKKIVRKIIVNGREYIWGCSGISTDNIEFLLGAKNSSISYRSGLKNECGIMDKGQAVALKNGMIFNVVKKRNSGGILNAKAPNKA